MSSGRRSALVTGGGSGRGEANGQGPAGNGAQAVLGGIDLPPHASTRSSGHS